MRLSPTGFDVSSGIFKETSKPAPMLYFTLPKLVDDSNTCNELSWNENGASFWDITGQQQWNWKDRICGTPNPGDSWCICMWATANLIKEVCSISFGQWTQLPSWLLYPKGI